MLNMADCARPPIHSSPKSNKKRKSARRSPTPETDECQERMDHSEDSDNAEIDESFQKQVKYGIESQDALHLTKGLSQSVGEYLPAVIFTILGVAAVSVGGYKLLSTTSTQQITAPFKLGESVVEELGKKFTNQADFCFKTIRSSVDRITNSKHEPTSPSSIILVSSPGAEKTVNCFADYLANYLSKLVHNDFVNIDSKKYEKQDPDNVKLTIDNEIDEYASTNKLNVILMRNIEYLPGKSPLIFYRYCDDQNAPYKKTVMIMTIFGQKPIPKKFSYKEVNTIARDTLNTSWASITPDEFDPLYNRIAGYIAGISSENDLSHCKL